MKEQRSKNVKKETFGMRLYKKNTKTIHGMFSANVFAERMAKTAAEI